ncbi:MAG TPA: TlpA disulfide reductase family protein [Thermodesulfovibrionales bacterium]|nr:TlpA disulfide reductase family protein [Thermodesulfovibrionales bacterium]
MKKKGFILLIVFVAAVAALYFISRTPQSTKVTLTEIGSPPPDFELTDINNNHVKIRDLKGSVVLVNFWATWCGSCVEEIPSMEKMFRQLSGDSRFKLVTILYKDDLQRATGFMLQNGYTFPVYVNPDSSAEKTFGITGVPETFILDKKGTLRHKVIGPEEWDSPRVLDALRSMMNEP